MGHTLIETAAEVHGVQVAGCKMFKLMKQV